VGQLSRQAIFLGDSFFPSLFSPVLLRFFPSLPPIWSFVFPSLLSISSHSPSFSHFLCHLPSLVRFEVLTAATVKMTVFCDVTPRGACCLHHEGDRPDYTAQQLRRQPSSYSPPWEPQISRRLYILKPAIPIALAIDGSDTDFLGNLHDQWLQSTIYLN
jgi:hypothetical protein